jgi:hypothetical protein
LLGGPLRERDGSIHGVLSLAEMSIVTPQVGLRLVPLPIAVCDNGAYNVNFSRYFTHPSGTGGQLATLS